MSRKGEGTTFTIDRKIFTSDLWQASPWKLKIWVYLLGNANHADGEFLGIKIKRGQILRSLRTIRNDCAYKIGYRIKKPSLDTVRRICEDFTKELRTVQETLKAGTLITILNYNKLQPNRSTINSSESYTQSYTHRTPIVHNNNDSKNVLKESLESKDSKNTCLDPFEILKGLSLYESDAKLLKRWSELYPAFLNTYPDVDVQTEINKMHTWELASPKNRKKDRGKFMNNWLSRAQDKAKAAKPKSEVSNDYSHLNGPSNDR